jgi:hypothetical protein
MRLALTEMEREAFTVTTLQAQSFNLFITHQYRKK